MKGITATELITALAVGLIIIGILAYLVITWVGKGSGQVNEQACRARALGLCTSWKLSGYNTTLEPDTTEFENDGCPKYITFNVNYCQSLTLL
ncbi:hypothetical protein A3K63_01355 [Candidatus Micrarchaeota archaeon RBG_16_49_10]|nr:MAG: hypothetical protein A3K63_01355 [Candidatus Micrarchaeota archaeon RBG_16_49_10]